ncbi:T9SS type A sorting domain-containing protein [Fluviicola sp.]|uniref:T9SS type A sorting domain-containing protein n=1 Tax=Fluviicola sp. TaxID=1917219 RepID=UPI0031D2BE19
MNQKLRQILFFVALVLTGSSYAQQTINVSTGWNNGVVALNTLEDSWNVTTPSNTVVTPKSCQNSGLWDYTNCSRWISSAVASNGNVLQTTPGTYTYRMNFTITPQTITCARFVINAIGADNTINGFSINGNSYFSSLGMPSGNNHFDPLKQNVEIYINPAHLTVGTNTITVTTYNNPDLGGDSDAAFNLCGEIRINEDFNIHPVVTGPTTICQGSPLTFGGALASGSNPSTHYYWRLYECDAAGNIVTNGFYWESLWFTGVPTGTYTFPSNLSVTCGKYYMAVLSAVKESSCANWAQDIHVFYYACKPTVNAGVDQTICQGECVTIGTTILTKGVSYNWSANGTYVGSGINISVCPETTTTYTLTATNNLTGCSSTDQVVVTVLPNEPRFNIATNTTNNNYYTVTGTPIVMNANTVAGFGQYWRLEELDANGNSLFNIESPNVWWPYPASCTFTGFDDYSLNYSGTYTTLPSSPTSGRFLYNHTYRITRGTWNNNCDWNQFSYSLTTVKSANGEGYQVMVEETTAPDFRSLAKEATESGWNISPNPSTGIFTVASESQETKQTIFEVFDLFGKKVVSKVIEAGTTRLSLDLSGNAKGVYILNITTDGVSKTHKIAVE